MSKINRVLGGIPNHDCASLKQFQGLLNDQEVTILENKQRWRVKKGHAQLEGTMNGAPMVYKLTHGAGLGSKDNHYLYMDLDPQTQYLIFVGDEWPSRADIFFFVFPHFYQR